jgi:hypothetical protein
LGKAFGFERISVEGVENITGPESKLTDSQDKRSCIPKVALVPIQIGCSFSNPERFRQVVDSIYKIEK